MDQTQNQHQQGGAQNNTRPAPIAPNPNGANNTQNVQQGVANGQGQGMTSPHLLELMTNPALAAAAAASPLFPPAAMISNPGAFFAMPDVYAANRGMQNNGVPLTHINSQQNASRLPLGNQQLYQLQLGQQSQIQGAQVPNAFPLPATEGASSLQVTMAAAAAAANATASGGESKVQKKGRRKKDLSPAERAKQNRDRNREHARSTRLRKKAYIQRLKELVEGLHSERTEEVRQRRVAIQHLAEVQNVRRAVIHSFLRFMANYEKDKRKWSTILEDDFWLKQPVTPYRCFRRSEIEQECRISRGVDSVVADAASISVMIEGVGSRSTRWRHIKREDFLLKEEERTGRKYMPRSIQNSRFQHAVSSLSASSSSNSSNTGSSGEEASKNQQQSQNDNASAKKISNSSGSSNERNRRNDASGDFHDYHAKPLPDPKLADSSERSSNFTSEESPEESNGSGNDDTKRVSTDSSSGDDSAAAIRDPRPPKRRKHQVEQGIVPPAVDAKRNHLPKNIAKKGGISHNVHVMYSNVAIPRNKSDRLSVAPAIALPPFAGIGKKSQSSSIAPAGTSVTLSSNQVQANGSEGSKENSIDQNTSSIRRPRLANVAGDGPAVLISGDVETSSSSSGNRPQVRAYFHLNEDDLILMDDILMCPFVFRTQDAVLCGALAECVMPGMLRAHFSTTNKLKSLEMIYDSMGFMQQLERASGNEMTAQIIPGSLEMALSPTAMEARVITLAEKPYRIVNVNEAWTKLTKYTQMEVEGLELFKIMDGEVSEGDSGDMSNLPYDLDGVNEGRCTCATRLHFDKDGHEFVDFIASYPLTNTSDEITHILHVSKELPPLQESVAIQEAVMTGVD